MLLEILRQEAFSQVEVKFSNDAFDARKNQDRDLYVDQITLNGTVYQTEAATVYSQGSTSACSDGYNQTEQLSCNGYFLY